jgi:hypothetical protein
VFIGAEPTALAAHDVPKSFVFIDFLLISGGYSKGGGEIDLVIHSDGRYLRMGNRTDW